MHHTANGVPIGNNSLKGNIGVPADVHTSVWFKIWKRFVTTVGMENEVSACTGVQNNHKSCNMSWGTRACQRNAGDNARRNMMANQSMQWHKCTFTLHDNNNDSPMVHSRIELQRKLKILITWRGNGRSMFM